MQIFLISAAGMIITAMCVLGILMDKQIRELRAAFNRYIQSNQMEVKDKEEELREDVRIMVISYLESRLCTEAIHNYEIHEAAEQAVHNIGAIGLYVDAAVDSYLGINYSGVPKPEKP